MKVASSLRVAHAQRLGRRDEPLAQLVVDRLVHQDALHADAALARLVERAEDDALRPRRRGRRRRPRCTAALPPSSSTTFLRPACAFRSQPTVGRAGEGQQLEALVGREEIGAVARRGQDREGALRQLGLGQHLADDQRAHGRARSRASSTNGQPAAIAGATLCAARFSGKLNGRDERARADRHALPHAAVAARARG